jgi:exodeoxyribonuclease X
MSVVILDTETTSKDDPQIVEAAYLEVEISGIPRAGTAFVSRYKPTVPITYGAMAVHNIMEEDLEGCPPSSSFALPGDVEYIIGHNVDFDWRAIGEPPVKRICTLAICRSLWPEVDSHTQSAMLYYLDRAKAREALTNAHSALSDVLVCFTLLQFIFLVAPVDSFASLWELSEAARVPTVMPFGKHKGQPISAVPADYIGWLLKQPDVDPYLVKALKTR